MIRILHVFSTFCSAGPQVRFALTANRLGREFAHAIIAMDGNYEALQRIDPDVCITRVAPPPRSGSFFGAIRLRRIIREHQPDLLVTYNWGAMDALTGAMLARCCPVIHTEDGFNPDEALNLKRRRVIARHVLLNRIYATVVPSHTLLDIAQSAYRVRTDKLRLIVNAVDTQRFSPGRNVDMRQRFGATEDTVLIGYVGHLRPEKNLTVLLHAFAVSRLRNAKLVFVGDGTCRTELQTLAMEMGLSDRVHFAGVTVDPRPYLQALDVFAMSSYTEQMPMSLLEAMACGLPVIATDVGDCGRMLAAPASPVIVPSGDVPAFTAALSNIAVNPVLRGEIGRQNRERCVTQYSLGHMVQSYAELYRQASMA